MMGRAGTREGERADDRWRGNEARSALDWLSEEEEKENEEEEEEEEDLETLEMSQAVWSLDNNGPDLDGGLCSESQLW